MTRVGIEVKDRDIHNIIQILNSHVNREIKLNDLLIQILAQNICSSDLLFLILEKLEGEGYVKGLKGVLKIQKSIEVEKEREIGKEVKEETGRKRKLFITPLEIGKFYQCPRRVFLEKVVLAREYKEERGKTWDGEVVHLTISLFVKNMMKMSGGELVKFAVKTALKKYEGKTTISMEKLEDFLTGFHELVKEENFSFLFTEKTIESFKNGIVGTPDIIAIKEEEVVPIDIKLGKLSRRGVKEEHLLQNIGESILLEDFFRKKIESCYLIYFESNFLVKVEIDEGMKRKFISYKKELERMCKREYVPKIRKILNLKQRVCAGCHVRASCENIEMLRKIIY